MHTQYIQHEGIWGIRPWGVIPTNIHQLLTMMITNGQHGQPQAACFVSKSSRVVIIGEQIKIRLMNPNY